MNRIVKIIQSLLFITLLSVALASCGKESEMKTTAQSGSNALGGDCACNVIYSPVCGSDGKDYDNSCIASCFKATVKMQGRCECKEDRKVCGSDNVTYSECEAQEKKIQIIKFAACDAQTY